jgi:hypothetical protein
MPTKTLIYICWQAGSMFRNQPRDRAFHIDRMQVPGSRRRTPPGSIGRSDGQRGDLIGHCPDGWLL